MTKFNQDEFNKLIIEQGILGFFKEPIKLVSGRMSSYYVNWRNVASDVYLLDKLADKVLDFTEDLNIKPDVFYGVPEGATKLGLICQYKWAKRQKNFGQGSHIFSMGRAKPKDHGEPKDRFFVGEPKGKVVVIEDVTNTGGSLIKSVEKLLELRVNIVAALALTNRNVKMDSGKTVKETLAEKKVPYFSLSQSLDLLPIMVKEKKPSEEIKKSIKEEFETYGEQKINI